MGMDSSSVRNRVSSNSVPLTRAISAIFHPRISLRDSAEPCMWPSATYPPFPSLRYAYAIPADIVSPSHPRIWASTQWVTAPMGIFLISVISAPSGITEDTDTRFCSPMPALMSAMSKALRSETSLTAELLVMKNLEGTSSMVMPTAGRYYPCRSQTPSLTKHRHCVFWRLIINFQHPSCNHGR